ncbi:MAG: four helix bundle protein [Myxococcota bacterium]
MLRWTPSIGLAPWFARSRVGIGIYKRASQSMALNLAEAHGSRAGNRRARLETALGSTQESRVALRIAAAWGYVDRSRARSIDAELDRVAAMTWRWLHPR